MKSKLGKLMEKKKTGKLVSKLEITDKLRTIYFTRKQKQFVKKIVKTYMKETGRALPDIDAFTEWLLILMYYNNLNE